MYGWGYTTRTLKRLILICIILWCSYCTYLYSHENFSHTIFWQDFGRLRCGRSENRFSPTLPWVALHNFWGARGYCVSCMLPEQPAKGEMNPLWSKLAYSLAFEGTALALASIGLRWENRALLRHHSPRGKDSALHDCMNTLQSDVTSGEQVEVAGG